MIFKEKIYEMGGCCTVQQVGKVCFWNSKEIEEGGLQIDVYTYTHQIDYDKLRKRSASEGELVDPTLYKKLIRSSMYLVNNRSNICFHMNTLN